MLDVADFGRNPHADEFGEHGVLYVRHGKAMKGSSPKRPGVLTVWAWVPEVLAEWIEEIRPLLAIEGNPALWPSERAPRVGLAQLNVRLSAYRDALGLDAGLDFHSLRRSHVTHLIEAGWDPLFVQQQVGHEHASTTAIYTCVSVGLSHPHAAAGSRRDHGRGTTTGREGPMSMKRQVSYRWRLREMMAARGVFTAIELVPLLHERGIDLSASQVHRLVTGTPERLSLPVLAALCDILEVTPADLVVTTAANVGPRKAVAGDAPAPVDLATVRPRRARVRPD